MPPAGWCWLGPVLAACGLLAVADGAAEAGGGAGAGAEAACPATLRSTGRCAAGGECAYEVRLPALTVQLPAQWGRLEEVFKEVQNLKETVNSLKKSCQDCKLQADDSRAPGRGGQLSPSPGAPGEAEDGRVRELESEVNKLSADLKDAKEEIDVLHGRLEELSLVNMNNIENYVDSKVANLTSVVNSLDGKCSSKCPSQEHTQSRPGMYDAFSSLVPDFYIAICNYL